ncbi:unnamed protein product [Pylaiella littoralis]
MGVKNSWVILLAASVPGALLTTLFTIPVIDAATLTFANGRSIDAAATNAYSVSAADIDSDGDLDVVATRTGYGLASSVEWYENLDGKGTFAEGVVITEDGVYESATSVAVADLDGDGYPDFVVAWNIEDKVSWFSNMDGLGGFSIGADIAIDTVDVSRVTVADVDGDGDFDVISASFTDDRLTWYENTDGLGTFSVGLDLSTTADGSEMVIAADLDGDGDMDVLAASFYDDRVTWYDNSDGDGAFSLGVDLAIDANGATYVAAGDLDGDNDLDVVSASFYDGRVIWYENTDGAGTFAEGQDIDILESAQSVVTVDLDNDGDIDLVVSDYVGGNIVWYENTDGLASFAAGVVIAIDEGVTEVIAVDLDGDGDLDLLSASQDQGRIIWYENLLTSSDDDSGTVTATTTTSDGTTVVATAGPNPVITPAPSPSRLASVLPTPTPTVGFVNVSPSTSQVDGATDPPADTFAPGEVTPSPQPGSVSESPAGTSPPAGESSTEGADGGDDDKWGEAAWEIAVTVVGSVLGAVAAAIAVGCLFKRRHNVEKDQPSSLAVDPTGTSTAFHQ